MFGIEQQFQAVGLDLFESPHQPSDRQEYQRYVEAQQEQLERERLLVAQAGQNTEMYPVESVLQAPACQFGDVLFACEESRKPSKIYLTSESEHRLKDEFVRQVLPKNTRPRHVAQRRVVEFAETF